MKTILVLLPLTLALSACNQIGGQSSEFAAMGKGSIVDGSAAPSSVVINDPVPGNVGDDSSQPDGNDDSAPSNVVQNDPTPPVVVQNDPTPPVVVQNDPTPPVVVVQNDPTPPVVAQNNQAPQQVACASYGLLGSLWDASLLNKSPKYADAVNDGIKIEPSIILPELNFFRMEHPGFKLADNSLVLNQSGDVLKEKYGLELNANITLGADDEEGYYQIGYYGEDEFSVKVDGVTMAIPKKEFTQGPSTKFRFFIEQGQTPLEFKLMKGKTYSLNIRTSQNNKSDFAMILLWRKARGLDEPARDLKVKQLSGNDSNADIREMINEDIEDHWSILKSANFLLPGC